MTIHTRVRRTYSRRRRRPDIEYHNLGRRLNLDPEGLSHDLAGKATPALH